MTREEVKATFKSGNGLAIAQALRTYFAEKIAEEKIKPLQFYKQGELNPEEKNISGKNEVSEQRNEQDIVSIAEKIFSV